MGLTAGMLFISVKELRKWSLMLFLLPEWWQNWNSFYRLEAVTCKKIKTSLCMDKTKDSRLSLSARLLPFQNWSPAFSFPRRPNHKYMQLPALIDTNLSFWNLGCCILEFWYFKSKHFDFCFPFPFAANVNLPWPVRCGCKESDNNNNSFLKGRFLIQKRSNSVSNRTFRAKNQICVRGRGGLYVVHDLERRATSKSDTRKLLVRKTHM